MPYLELLAGIIIGIALGIVLVVILTPKRETIDDDYEYLNQNIHESGYIDIPVQRIVGIKSVPKKKKWFTFKRNS